MLTLSLQGAVSTTPVLLLARANIICQIFSVQIEEIRSQLWNMLQIFHLDPSLARKAIIKNATKILLESIALAWINILQIMTLLRLRIRDFLFRNRTDLEQTVSKNSKREFLTSMQLWILGAVLLKFMSIIQKLI